MTIDEALAIIAARPYRNKLSCPAHMDRTASLQLYSDSWYCFSCARSGDAYGLIALFQDRPVSEVLRDLGPSRDPNMRVTTAVRVAPWEMRKALRLSLVLETHPLFLALRQASLKPWARDLLDLRADQWYADWRELFMDEEVTPRRMEQALTAIREDVATLPQAWGLLGEG